MTSTAMFRSQGDASAEELKARGDAAFLAGLCTCTPNLQFCVIDAACRKHSKLELHQMHMQIF